MVKIADINNFETVDNGDGLFKGYLDGSAGSSIYQSNSNTITTGRSVGIVLSTPYNITDITNAYAFDGTNFVNSNFELVNNSNTGTSLVIKSTGTHSESLGLTSSDRNINYIDGTYMMYD